MVSLETVVIAAREVRVEVEPRRVAPPTTTGQTEPEVKVIRDGNEIIGAEVTCGCGQRVRLRFDFDG